MASFDPNYDTCSARDVIGRAIMRRSTELQLALVERVRSHELYSTQVRGRSPDIWLNVERQITACREAYSLIETWHLDQLELKNWREMEELSYEIDRQFTMRNEVFTIACNLLQVPRDLRAIILART